MEDHRVGAEATPSDAPPPAGSGAGSFSWPDFTAGSPEPSPFEPPAFPPSGFPPPPYEPPTPPGTGPLWPEAHAYTPEPPGDPVHEPASAWAPPAPLVPPPLIPPPLMPEVAATTPPVRAAGGAVGRASAPMTAPPSLEVPVQRGTASTYRAGELARDADDGTDPLADPPATEPVAPRITPAPGGSGELPRRREGAALAAEAPGFLADLPTRGPRGGGESPWAAFAKPWLDEEKPPAAAPYNVLAQPEAPQAGGPSDEPAAFAAFAETSPGGPPASASEVAFGSGAAFASPADVLDDLRTIGPADAPDGAQAPPPAIARAVVIGEPASAADVAGLRRPAEPRVYRSGQSGGPDLAAPPEPAPAPRPLSVFEGLATLGSAGPKGPASPFTAFARPELADPPNPPEPPNPPSPPEPEPEPAPQPPTPAPTPEPPSPPGPPPPSPIPTPFPGPVPLPTPPAPVPPEPPTPEPTPGPVPPGPPIPPTPPFPQPPSPVPPSPIPPGPAPLPPFPPPPATPAGALPTWPPSTRPGPAHDPFPRTPQAAPVPDELTVPAGPPPLGQPEYVERLAWRGQPAPERVQSDRYGEWARAGRPQGTVYGGQPAPAALPMNLENSGSLTGHILAQGHPVVPLPSTGRSKFMVAVVVVVCLLVLAAIVAGVTVVMGMLTN